MKSFSKRIAKSWIFLFLTGIGLIGFSRTFAQSIVGKWNQVSSKQVLTEEGARSYGKKVLETDMSAIGTVVYEFRSDHTYTVISTTIRDKTSHTFKGEWSLNSDELTMSSNGTAVKSKTKIQEDILILDTFYPKSKITSEIVVTFKKS